MFAASPIRRSALALFLAACSALACAQAPAFEPKIDQPGKDVEWVPTPQALVNKMLDIAKLAPEDTLIDLGSGDGRTVITAAQRGARALGIEFNPDLVEFSKRSAAKAGVAARAEFVKADLFEADLSRATVITLFLLPEINAKLRPKLLDLEPGTRIVSNTFSMDDWVPDDSAALNPATGCSGEYCTALLWIVPARVAGNYRHALGTLHLGQNFQMLTGTLVIEDKAFVVEGRVRGREVSFRAGDQEYSGRVNGKVLELQ